jgi:hypothetical protein
MMLLSPRLISAYYRQIDRMRASDLLEALRVSLAPHISQGDRSQLTEELRRRADGIPKSKITITDNEGLNAFLQSAAWR